MFFSPCEVFLAAPHRQACLSGWVGRTRNKHWCAEAADRNKQLFTTNKKKMKKDGGRGESERAMQRDELL